MEICKASKCTGCGFNDSLCLEHMMTSDVQDLERFKGSKYLQSYSVGI